MKKTLSILSLGLVLALTACGPTSAPTSAPSIDPTVDPTSTPTQPQVESIDYTITVLYEDETPFVGARVQGCTVDGESCLMPKPTDENGVVVLNMEKGSYELHVINVPEGYHYDEDGYVVTPENPDTTIYIIAD